MICISRLCRSCAWCSKSAVRPILARSLSRQVLRRGLAEGPHLLEENARILQCDEAINIQFTSGTTGSPKGATLTHHNLINNALFAGELMNFTPDDRLCIPVPFYHCFGMVLANLACITHGAAMIVPGEAFDAKAVLETIEAERCTALHGVPTMFIALLSIRTSPALTSAPCAPASWPGPHVRSRSCDG